MPRMRLKAVTILRVIQTIIGSSGTPVNKENVKYAKRQSGAGATYGMARSLARTSAGMAMPSAARLS